MNEYLYSINYNELDNYVTDNGYALIYVSVLEDETIREFEKKFKSKYKSRKIEHELLYMNITEDIKNNDIRDDMVSKYNINDLDVLDVPCVLVFNDGMLKSIYSISDNNYDVERFTIYLNNIELESDGI